MIVSLSGPSKSGKTVLVKRMIDSENLIALSGASIRSADDLWANVLSWMDVPSERSETSGGKITGETTAKAGGKAGIAFLAEAKAEVGGTLGGEKATTQPKRFGRIG
jgi:hypothetical protein